MIIKKIHLPILFIFALIHISCTVESTSEEPAEVESLKGLVRGTIYDSNQVPLFEVNVISLSKRSGSVSTNDGEYSIELDEGEHVLVFSRRFFISDTTLIYVPRDSTIYLNVILKNLYTQEEI